MERNLVFEKIHRRYLCQCILVLIAVILIFLLSFYILSPFRWGYLALGLIIFLVFLIEKSLIMYFASINFHPIIYNEFDPEKYLNLLSYKKKRFVFTDTYTIPLLLNGEFQKVVSYLNNRLKQGVSLKKKLFIFTQLAKIYFQNGEKENLRNIVDQFNECKLNSKNYAKIDNKYLIMRYYEHYLEGNYKKCLEICKRIEQRNDKHKTKRYYEYLKFNLYYFNAIAYFNLGDKEKAKLYFDKIITCGPKMHDSVLAQKYLEKIINDDFTECEFLPITVLDDYTEFQSGQFKKLRRRKIIMIVLCVMLIVSFSFSAITKLIPSEFERKLYDALDEEYGEYKLIEHSDVYASEEFICHIYIITVENKVIVGYIGTTDDGETFCVSGDKVVTYDTPFTLNAFDHELHMKFSTKAITSGYYFVLKELKIHDKNVWFYIDYIVTYNQ